MSSLPDAEVIGHSLVEPEAFGLIYDRYAATLHRFLGRRAGDKIAEGLIAARALDAAPQRTHNLRADVRGPWSFPAILTPRSLRRHARSPRPRDRERLCRLYAHPGEEVPERHA